LGLVKWKKLKRKKFEKMRKFNLKILGISRKRKIKNLNYNFYFTNVIFKIF